MVLPGSAASAELIAYGDIRTDASETYGTKTHRRTSIGCDYECL